METDGISPPLEQIHICIAELEASLLDTLRERERATRLLQASGRQRERLKRQLQEKRWLLTHQALTWPERAIAQIQSQIARLEQTLAIYESEIAPALLSVDAYQAELEERWIEKRGLLLAWKEHLFALEQAERSEDTAP